MGEVLKAPRVRAKRRNYEAELRDLLRYCEISVQVMEALTDEERPIAQDAFLKGQIAALQAVKARLEGGTK